MLVGGVIHPLEQRTGEAEQHVALLGGEPGHADPAGQGYGLVGEGHVVGQLGGFRHFLEDLQTVGAPCGAGVHAAGEHRGHNGGGVHIKRLNIVHRHAVFEQAVDEDVLGGGA